MKVDSIVNEGEGDVSTKTKIHKIAKSSATAVTTKTKKKNNAKEKEEFVKVILRRLPAEMTKTELWEQLQPLPADPRAFWFCPADPELRPNAFCRAYIVFRAERDAISFAERFHGYVFVDKQGNESMSIVECAPNQHVPKDLDKPAKECDARSSTLESEAPYLKFLDQYNSSLAASTRRVTNFDDLVRELEERQRRIDQGQVQETPLTTFFRQSMDKKTQKKQQRLVDRFEKEKRYLAQCNLQEKETGGSGTAKEKKQPRVRERKNKKMDDKKSQEVASPNGPYDNRGVGGTVSALREAAETKGANSNSKSGMGKKERINGKKLNKRDRQTENVEKPPVDEKKVENANNSSVPVINAEKPLKAKRTDEKKQGGGGSGRNKDRPEREIYRPGRNRLQQQQRKPVNNEGEKKENNDNVSVLADVQQK